jgi:hypothetical protein
MEMKNMPHFAAKRFKIVSMAWKQHGDDLVRKQKCFPKSTMDTAPSWFQFLFVFAFRPLGLGAT